MIRLLPHLALLAASLLLANCSKPEAEAAAPQKPVEINGQVFVIQKNRVNVKLGGVEVHYVPREAFEERCRWIEKNTPKAFLIASYEKDLEEIDSVIEAAGEEPYAGKIRDFLSAARERQSDAWKRLRGNKALEDHRLHWLAVAENRESFEDAGFEESEEHWKLAALFFQWLAEHASVTTQTDADGNYGMSLPGSGEGFLFARSSRQLSSKESESYLWIQKVSASTTGPVHLASTSCLSPGELRRFLLTSAAVEAPSMDKIVKEYELSDLSWFTGAEALLRRIEDNEIKVSSLKEQADEVKDEIEKANYMDMSAP